MITVWCMVEERQSWPAHWQSQKKQTRYESSLVQVKLIIRKPLDGLFIYWYGQLSHKRTPSGLGKSAHLIVELSPYEN